MAGEVLKNVLIIGGGLAGCTAAETLAERYAVMAANQTRNATTAGFARSVPFGRILERIPG